MEKIIYKYFWLIRIIVRNLDGSKSHYPTRDFIKECNLSSKNCLMKILNWQTDNRFVN
ncbi:hypothetical protein N2W52_001947 [Clostridium perfringens]|nr:hypothetical protein [Clostridium perfringens]